MVNTSFMTSVVVVVMSMAADTSRPVEDKNLRELTVEFWEWKLREFPEQATVSGFHQYDDQLESFAYPVFERRLRVCIEFQRRATALQPSRLSPPDRLTLNILLDQLGTYIDGYAWRDHGNLNPVNFLEGIHRNNQWITQARYRNVEDYTKYLQRLSQLPKQLEEIQDLLERAVQLNRTNHKVSMAGVEAELQDIGNSAPARTMFYAPYGSVLERLRPLSNDIKHNIRSEGLIAITRVQLAFKRLAAYIRTYYMQYTRTSIGVDSLSDGSEYYTSVLRWHLSVNLTAQQVHDIGTQEVRRIRRQINEVTRRLGFHDDIAQFPKFLRSKTQYYNHTSETEYLNLFKYVIEKRITPQLWKLFTNIDAIPAISVTAMPNDGVAVQYIKDTLQANTRRLHTRPSFDIMTLSLHEALPGHHLQFSVARRQPLADFRRHVWGGRKYSAPFHFSYYTSYVEGWALYAEYLGEELGLYDNPYELLSRYCFEIFRACRLVVDTGIHVFGWSRDQAIEYMSNNTFLARELLEIEVDRYITWPGQACAYKIGELSIRKLRVKAEENLGAKFDIRNFHSAVMGVGAVSLDILDEFVDDWIHHQRSRASHINIHIAYCVLAIAIVNLSVPTFLTSRCYK